MRHMPPEYFTSNNRSVFLRDCLGWLVKNWNSIEIIRLKIRFEIRKTELHERTCPGSCCSFVSVLGLTVPTLRQVLALETQ